MSSPIGVDAVTSLARRYILPEIHDQVYSDNPITFRLVRANKKLIQGGTQIEVPLMYKRTGVGGAYSGYDVFAVSPADTIKNAVHDWKQYQVPVAIDGLTLIKTDQPQAIANLVSVQFEQADMEMAEHLADGIWSDGSDAKKITGLNAAIDDGTVAATYGGILRSANTWWKSQVDAATTTLTLAKLQTGFMNAAMGGKAPTIIVSRKDNYLRYLALCQTNQQFQVMAAGHDEQLATAGFTNALFDNVPWVTDSHVPDGANSSNSQIYMLNEQYISLAVSPRADFRLEDFQKPINQDAMVSNLFWAGQLAIHNCARHAKFTAITA